MPVCVNPVSVLGLRHRTDISRVPFNLVALITKEPSDNKKS